MTSECPQVHAVPARLRLLAYGGTLVEKLAEDAPVRDRYKRQRAGE